VGNSEQILLKLSELFGREVSISEKRGVGGGCINQTSVLVLDRGERVFLKENSDRFRDMFKAEFLGLQAMATEAGPHVPKPYAYGEADGGQFLLLEYVDEGRRSVDFSQDFGRRLALMHSQKRSREFGFESDNYIGASPQVNTWEESWPGFFARHRLGYQLELARRNGRASARWARPLERIIERIGDYLTEPDHASILHGDLWGGNYMVGTDGHAVLIDPAVYYGDRETDLAMTELFGGFGSAFYSAYHEVLPIDPGYRERKDLYNLYHLLNHLNLFGGSYAGSVASIVARYQ